MKNHQTKFKETEIGLIPEEWEVLSVGDVAELNTEVVSGRDGGRIIEYLDTASVHEGSILGFQKLSLAEAPSRARRVLKDGDTIISTVRPNLKHFAFIENASENWIGSTGFVVVTPKKIDPCFLYYSLTKDSVTNFLSSVAASQTSAYPSFNPSLIEEMLISVPSELEQKHIASILSSIDSKIQLNRQINANLEKVTSTLFKRWFVDFEFPDEKGKPYKSSGGKMVDSEMGEIPEGWKVNNFTDVVESSISGDWGSESEVGEFGNKVFCVRGADVIDLKKGGKGKMPIRFIKDTNFRNKCLRDGDIVIETSGGTPTQSTGRCVRITEELLSRFEQPLICSNFCKIIRLKDVNQAAYFSVVLDEMYKRNDFFQFENGTSGIKNLDINSLFESLYFPLDNRVSLKFSYLSDGLYQVIQKNGLQSNILSQIRDSILPRLMSGVIRTNYS